MAQRTPFPGDNQLFEVLKKEFMWKAKASISLLSWNDSLIESACFENMRDDYELEDVFSQEQLAIAKLHDCRQRFRVFGLCDRKLAFLTKPLLTSIGKYL